MTIVLVQRLFATYLVNFSSEDIHIVSRGFGVGLQATPGIKTKENRNLPNMLPAHSSTGEILLMTLEINRDGFEAIENMMIGSYHFGYTDSSGTMYQTAPALFQLILQP